MKHRMMLMDPLEKPGEKPPEPKPGEKPPEEKKPEEKQTLLGDNKPPEEKKPEEKKPEEQQPPVKKGLDKYDIKLPDKSILDAAILERTAATARELGLSDNEAAQRVLDFVGTEVKTHLETLTAATQPGGSEWTKNVEAWEAQALADKEIGGSQEALQATATKARRVLKTYFPPSVSTMLHNTGFGSHPDVLRALVKIAKAVGEDTLVQLEGPKTPEKKSPADLFYSGSTSKKE